MSQPYSIFRSIQGDLPRLNLNIYTPKTDSLLHWIETLRGSITIALDVHYSDHLYCIDSLSYNLHLGDCQVPSVRATDCTLVDEETFRQKVEEAISDFHILR